MDRIDLNCDLGESFGAYRIGLDEEVVPHVTSVNIACGWHAGDPLVMEKTVAMAKQHHVAVGAHPGFPDLLGFGRREIKASPDEVYAYVKYQLGALYAFAHSQGLEVQHMKAHGSLYNMAGKAHPAGRGHVPGLPGFRLPTDHPGPGRQPDGAGRKRNGRALRPGIFRRPGLCP